MKKKLLLILFISKTIFLFGQDKLPFIIDFTITLDSINSPYYIEDDTEIATNGELIINAGVQILISPGKKITNNGRLIVKGTANKPVSFLCSNENSKWDYITNNQSLISENLIVKNAIRFVSSYGDTVILKNCNFSDIFGGAGDDLIGVHNANKLLITGCKVIGNPEAGKTDGLDLDGIANDTIANNEISGFSDDGIDVGTNSQNIFIANNKISHCNMGISVGESSTCLLIGNLLTYNDAGIQSHSGSVTKADRNTLFGNSEGLRVFHDNGQLSSGGTLEIYNSIISNCTKHLLALVSNSVLMVNYCLSDSILPNGNGNLLGNAGFLDTFTNNFTLTPFSLAIDAGNPDNDGDNIDYETDIDDQDPDGSRIDLGYLPYFNSPILINEVIPSNLNLVADEFDSYPDMIELHNTSTHDIDLKNFSISDNPNNLFKHNFLTNLIIPANGFVALWADGLERDTLNHLNFKLSGEGEYLSIVNENGQLLDEVYFPMVPVNKSYGRTSQTKEWVYFESPSPMGKNPSEGKTSISTSPVFTHNGSPTSFPVNLGFENENSGLIKYTLDGSDPENGIEYSSVFSLTEPSVVRAVNIEPNKITCYPETRFYFTETNVSLPVLSISTNEENIYGETGIYTNYNGSGPNWERPVSLTYYHPTLKFKSTSGIRIQGGNSVSMSKKSFRLFFRGGYGNTRLMASPFSKGPTTFKNLVLRSGYDDDITTSTGTLLRDPLSAEFWGLLGETATKSDWISLHLNNKYWGIYNIRESINEYFVEDNLNITEFDLVRFQKWGVDLKYGTIDSWNYLEDFFNTTDFTRPETYFETAEFIDMNSLLNLLAFVHCAQFRSWTWGTFGIKPTNGKWTWTIWDTDRAYSDNTWNGFEEYSNTSAEKWPNFIPQKLFQNEYFKNQLINRVCDLLNSKFLPDYAVTLYDSLVNIIESDIANEFERWNSGNLSKWEVNNNKIKTFLNTRPTEVREQIKQYFNISDSVIITIKIIGNGQVKLNSLTIYQEEWLGTYMSEIPIELEAIPDFGSSFLGWEGLSPNYNITLSSETDKTITAIFDTTYTQEHVPLIINEIMYHPSNNGGGEWIELFNPNKYPVSLSGCTVTDGGIGNGFAFPDVFINPEGYIVVVGNNAEFTPYFNQVVNKVGNFNEGTNGFALSNNGEKILLFNADGLLIDSVYYSDSYPWPENTDGYGASLQLTNFTFDNTLPASWFSSITNPYSPGESNTKDTSIKTVFTEEIKIYPIPFNNDLLLEFWLKSDAVIDLQFYNLLGVLVYKENNIDIKANGHIINSTPKLSGNGIYLLRITTKTKNEKRDQVLKIIRH